MGSLSTVRQPAPDAARVLSTAAVRAAEFLGVNQTTLAGCLGVSAATVSRMAKGGYLLDPARKEWELAALFVRLFRALESIVGGNDESARTWLAGDNLGLGDKPVRLIRTAEGRTIHAGCKSG